MDPWKAKERQPSENRQHGEAEDPWSADEGKSCYADPWTWKHRVLNENRSGGVSPREE